MIFQVRAEDIKRKIQGEAERDESMVEEGAE